MNRKSATFLRSLKGSVALQIILFVIIVSLIGGIYLFVAKSSPTEKPPPTSSENELETRAILTESTISFKHTAASDYAKAILVFGEGSTLEKLHGIDVRIFDASQSQVGWSIFFNSALQINANTKITSPVIGFYNPYTDLFLITVWKKNQDIYKIVDAELLLGDWIRGENNPVEIKPLWLRGDIHRPEKLGLSIAESVIAFEKMFEGATPTTWRERVTMLSDQQRFEKINDPFAKLRLNEHLINLLYFSQEKITEQTIKDSKTQIDQLIQNGKSGKIQESLQIAEGTLKNTADRLQHFPSEWFTTLQVAAILTDPNKSIIFLSPSRDTNCSLAITIKKIEGAMQIRRIDLVDYQFFYEQVNLRKKNTQKGEDK